MKLTPVKVERAHCNESHIESEAHQILSIFIWI